jgi:hypothetical protein
MTFKRPAHRTAWLPPVLALPALMLLAACSGGTPGVGPACPAPGSEAAAEHVGDHLANRRPGRLRKRLGGLVDVVVDLKCCSHRSIMMLRCLPVNQVAASP